MKFINATLALIISLFSTYCSDSDFAASRSNQANQSQLTGSDLSRKAILDALARRDISDGASLKKACENTTPQTLSKALLLPERSGCQWSQRQNLIQRQGFIQAFESTETRISLPLNAIICDLSLESKPGASLHYDDFVFFTLENQLIFGSNDGITKLFEQKNRLFQWDFQKIKGQPIPNFESPAFCIANQSACQLPGHDQKGPVSINLKSEDVAPLFFFLVGKNEAKFNLIATGDNDQSDCSHTELSLDLTIKYLTVN